MVLTVLMPFWMPFWMLFWNPFWIGEKVHTLHCDTKTVETTFQQEPFNHYGTKLRISFSRIETSYEKILNPASG